MDIDEASIIAARKTYARATNASFVVGRCEEFQSADKPFDVIVSFETLEHLDESGQQRFLDNLKRSLTPGGLLILSTPDRAEYGATRAHANEFHKHELSEQELRDTLAKRFRHVVLYGQRPITVSGLWALKGGKESPFSFERRDKLFAQAPDPAKFVSPIYLIAFCSDRPAAVPDDGGSMYYDLSCAKSLDDKMRWAEGVGEELEKRTAWALKLQGEFEERSKWAKSLDEELAKAREHFERLQKEFEERTAWALSLRDENERERAIAREIIAQKEEAEAARAEAERKMQELQMWGEGLDGDLHRITTSLLYRILASVGFLPKRG